MRSLLIHILLLLSALVRSQVPFSLPSAEPLIEGPVTYELVLSTYDDLYPVAERYFITHNNYYWGVIDSTGSVVLPFHFDGITYLGSKGFLCSTFLDSYSLNTGIPRYIYQGLATNYDLEGKQKRKFKFGLTVEFIADFFYQEHVIIQGPYFFLPEPYREGFF